MGANEELTQTRQSAAAIFGPYGVGGLRCLIDDGLVITRLFQALLHFKAHTYVGEGEGQPVGGEE